MHGGWSCVAEGGCMAGGVHGMGVCVVGGVSMAGGIHAWQERWPLQQMVRILLECILVQHENILHKN